MVRQVAQWTVRQDVWVLRHRVDCGSALEVDRAVVEVEEWSNRPISALAWVLAAPKGLLALRYSLARLQSVVKAPVPAAAPATPLQSGKAARFERHGHVRTASISRLRVYAQ